jgi:hypothetical protein
MDSEANPKLTHRYDASAGNNAQIWCAMGKGFMP